jgi:hypothetical protein
MSRQIQLRRGTAGEHANFTGAIGEITMDTDAKTLRVHDGETAGGVALARMADVGAPAGADHVAESWRAADGSSWYRRHSSGWVEQGGRSGTGYGQTITFPLQMADSNYTVITSVFADAVPGAGTTSVAALIYNPTAAGFTAYQRGGGATAATNRFSWFIAGYAA